MANIIPRNAPMMTILGHGLKYHPSEQPYDDNLGPLAEISFSRTPLRPQRQATGHPRGPEATLTNAGYWYSKQLYNLGAICPDLDIRPVNPI